MGKGKSRALRSGRLILAVHGAIEKKTFTKIVVKEVSTK